MKRVQNHSFFEKIDTEEKAYFLGLIYADGCHYIPKQATASVSVSISLQEQDKYILEHLNSLIYLNNPKPLEFRKKRKENHQNQFTFITHSRKISKDLISLGVPPRKSRILKFPTEEQVPSYLIHHFIRGYFDGDGSIYLSTKRKNRKNQSLAFRCSICGTNNFSSTLKNILDKLNISSVMELHNNSFILRIIGNRNCEKFGDWIYKESSLFLERKHIKFNLLKETILNIDKDKLNVIISAGEFTQKEFCMKIQKSRAFVYKQVKKGISHQELYDKYSK